MSNPVSSNNSSATNINPADSPPVVAQPSENFGYSGQDSVSSGAPKRGCSGGTKAFFVAIGEAIISFFEWLFGCKKSAPVIDSAPLSSPGPNPDEEVDNDNQVVFHPEEVIDPTIHLDAFPAVDSAPPPKPSIALVRSELTIPKYNVGLALKNIKPYDPRRPLESQISLPLRQGIDSLFKYLNLDKIRKNLPAALDNYRDLEVFKLALQFTDLESILSQITTGLSLLVKSFMGKGDLPKVRNTFRYYLQKPDLGYFEIYDIMKSPGKEAERQKFIQAILKDALSIHPLTLTQYLFTNHGQEKDHKGMLIAIYETIKSAITDPSLNAEQKAIRANTHVQGLSLLSFLMLFFNQKEGFSKDVESFSNKMGINFPLVNFLQQEILEVKKEKWEAFKEYVCNFTDDNARLGLLEFMYQRPIYGIIFFQLAIQINALTGDEHQSKKDSIKRILGGEIGPFTQDPMQFVKLMKANSLEGTEELSLDKSMIVRFTDCDDLQTLLELMFGILPEGKKKEVEKRHELKIIEEIRIRKENLQKQEEARLRLTEEARVALEKEAEAKKEAEEAKRVEEINRQTALEEEQTKNACVKSVIEFCATKDARASSAPDLSVLREGGISGLEFIRLAYLNEKDHLNRISKSTGLLSDKKLERLEAMIKRSLVAYESFTADSEVFCSAINTSRRQKLDAFGIIGDDRQKYALEMSKLQEYMQKDDFQGIIKYLFKTEPVLSIKG